MQGLVDNSLDIYPASELRVHSHVLLDCLWPASKGDQGENLDSGQGRLLGPLVYTQKLGQIPRLSFLL